MMFKDHHKKWWKQFTSSDGSTYWVRVKSNERQEQLDDFEILKGLNRVGVK